MVQFKIIDTGYGNVDATGTQSAVSNRAGYDGSSSVTAFTFNVTSIALEGGGSVMSQEELHQSENLTTNTAITYKNPSIVMQCSLPVQDISNTGFQHSWIYQLFRLERTKSVKLIYLSGTSEDTRLTSPWEGYAQYYVGGAFETAGIVSSNVPYTPVHITKIGSIRLSADRAEYVFSIAAIIQG